jgi:hypothetical protein
MKVKFTRAEVELVQLMCEHWLEGEAESLTAITEDETLQDEQLLKASADSLHNSRVARSIKEKLGG